MARALALDPKLVLADEPTGNLDSATAGAVVDLMTTLNRDLGTTFLLATHDPALILRARRRIRLTDGRVVEDFTA